MKILIVGNPVDGMHFIGPFDNSEAACAVGEESGADWWITDLKSRADWREELVQQDEAADEPSHELSQLLNRAAAALETPDDLTAEDKANLIVDLVAAAKVGAWPAPDSEADWVVVNRNDPSLRWSNEHGWVEHGFDTFGAKERATLALPIEGKWEASNT